MRGNVPPPQVSNATAEHRAGETRGAPQGMDAQHSLRVHSAPGGTMRTTEEVRTYQGQMCGQCNTVTPHWRYERTNGGANPWQCKDCGSKFNPQMTLSELPAAMPPEPEPVDVQAASIAVPQPAEPLILTRQDHVAMMQMSLTGLHQIANALSFIEPDAFPVDELAEFAARCVKLSFHKFAKE